MELRSGGIDLFYIDETEKYPIFAVTAVRVPFLRNVDGKWQFVWGDYLSKAIEWRRQLSIKHHIRFREELHAAKILSHQGLYKKPRNNLRPDEAVAMYKDALGTLDFLLPASIITTFATRETTLMGEKHTKAALIGLFQRIRRQCGETVNGMLFFDDGHPEYVGFYRKATRYLPTGSKLGGWSGKSTMNLALDMFPKDANVKASSQSLFLQIADLVAYAARMKLEHEMEILAAKRVKRGHAELYDSLLKDRINLAATGKRTDGIVPV